MPSSSGPRWTMDDAIRRTASTVAFREPAFIVNPTMPHMRATRYFGRDFDCFRASRKPTDAPTSATTIKVTALRQILNNMRPKQVGHGERQALPDRHGQLVLRVV